MPMLVAKLEQAEKCSSVGYVVGGANSEEYDSLQNEQ